MHSEYIYKEVLVTLNIDITEVKGCGNTYRKKKDQRKRKMLIKYIFLSLIPIVSMAPKPMKQVRYFDVIYNLRNLNKRIHLKYYTSITL